MTIGSSANSKQMLHSKSPASFVVVVDEGLSCGLDVDSPILLAIVKIECVH